MVALPERPTAIAVGLAGYSACGLGASGAVHGWGSIEEGTLGDGRAVRAPDPRVLHALVTAVPQHVVDLRAAPERAAALLGHGYCNAPWLIQVMIVM